MLMSLKLRDWLIPLGVNWENAFHIFRTTRPRIINLLPIVDRMERRLTASSSFLMQGADCNCSIMHFYMLMCFLLFAYSPRDHEAT